MQTVMLWFGLLMASIDVVILSLLKMRYMGQICGDWVFPFAFIVYGCQAILFYKALQYGTMIQMNMIWDVISDIIVTMVGLYLFKEAINNRQKLGVALGVIALLLLRS